ncbi:MAG TPA: ATP synthase F0 subunit B [Terriglobales bacterium]|nr:ATP synthase F0 subunit B [Terriglobales bacterium]
MKRLTIFLSLILLAAAALVAQHAEPAKPPAQSQPQQSQPAQAQPTPSPSQELVETSHAAAEGKEAEHGEEDEEAQFKYSASVQWLAKKTGLSKESAYWVFVALNFAVVAGLILWAWRKSMPLYFRDRTGSIKKQMEEARAASEEANRRLAEVEGRLARLDSEIAELRAQADRDAAAEEQRLRATAEEDRQKIVTQAEQEIASAAKLARGELKKYAAELAVNLAEQKIQVTPQADQALVHAFTEKLGTEAKS